MDFIKSVFKGLFWFGIVFFILGTYVGYEAAVATTYSQLKRENPEIAAKFFEEHDMKIVGPQLAY